MLQRKWIIGGAVTLATWGAGGFAPCDVAVQWGYDRILEAGMPYLTNYIFEASLACFVWFSICIYFTYLDFTRSPTKVQKDYWPTAREMMECAIPQIILYTLGCGYTWYQWATDDQFVIPITEKAPGFMECIAEVTACLVIGDFLIYWEHRWMHDIPLLRNHVHSVHHVYSAPFSWAGGWVHPIEDAVVVSAQVVPAVALNIHPLSRWVFAILWTVLLIDEHSGHDVWWSPYNWLIPDHRSIGGGADPHDIHHYLPNKNYSFVFCIWDRIFGTYQDPNPLTVNPYQPPYITKRRDVEVIETLRDQQVAQAKADSLKA
eukprot:TRINITY_DN6119_c0_g5_i1.p2 TRINITY_DN6119_c0_g5~~TRINITY_DN6119_c0_g5_i1.p2  ORF type:complete len:357 (+),score=106.00 TRINITY_DN6119_c0_g5_i1:123-1073(+)